MSGFWEVLTGRESTKRGSPEHRASPLRAPRRSGRPAGLREGRTPTSRTRPTARAQICPCLFGTDSRRSPQPDHFRLREEITGRRMSTPTRDRTSVPVYQVPGVWCCLALLSEDARMPSPVKAVPEGVPVVMPMLVCRDVAATLDFCKTTFGAAERLSLPGQESSFRWLTSSMATAAGG